MSLRQGLILAINTSILAVLFVFMSWLYRESRLEAQAASAAALERAAAITGELARLREKELGTLALSLSASPMLRGALATGDRATVEDVLISIREKNGLGEAAVLARGAAAYASRPDSRRGSAEALARGRLCGRGGDPSLIVCLSPDRVLLDSWSAITGARYRLTTPDGALLAANLDSAASAALAGRTLGAGLSEIDAGSSRYAAVSRPLLGGISAAMLVDQAPFWSAFQRRRNSLIVIGAGLFFLGLLLSIAFSELLARHAPRGAADEQWKRLLDEIEAARGAKR